jgi:hypothetical protein
MLINLRDKKNKLFIKDILDIEFDMCVEEKDNKYYVAVNKKYRYDMEFENEDDAENQMILIANARNNLEHELKNY